MSLGDFKENIAAMAGTVFTVPKPRQEWIIRTLKALGFAKSDEVPPEQREEVLTKISILIGELEQAKREGANA